MHLAIVHKLCYSDIITLPQCPQNFVSSVLKVFVIEVTCFGQQPSIKKFEELMFILSPCSPVANLSVDQNKFPS